jgi:hypothetical protein
MYYNYDTGLPTMFGTSSTDAACNSLVSSSVIYYNISLALTNGTPLYHNECLTIPITASAYTNTSQQYFKIGSYYVNFETNGYVVRDIAICPTTTTSTTTTTTTATPVTSANVSWNVSGSIAGGRLIIRNVGGTTLVDQSSTNGGTFSGNITISDTNLPYSVTGSWTGGTNTDNVVKYRICMSGSTTQIAFEENINTTIPSKYTLVSPTPVSSSVFLTSGVTLTPPTCSVLAPPIE